jgi:predicted metal-dependent phosphoesterase TrpH
MRADLHLHTTASDGRLEPRELVCLAATRGLEIIAITDHDTIGGVEPALEAAQSYSSISVVPGVEINTDVSHGEVHILGYFVDYNDDRFNNKLQGLRNSRRERAKKMLNELRRLKMNIEWNRVKELAKGGAICRPHIAQALMEKGYVKSEREAFDKYIGHNCPAYVEREKLSPSEAVRLITSAKGIPVLAHPDGILDLDALLHTLCNVGLVGIEVYYKGYGLDVIHRLLQFAKKYNLITTGGTDYHAFGDGLETMIGDTLAPEESVELLLTLAGKNV